MLDRTRLLRASAVLRNERAHAHEPSCKECGFPKYSLNGCMHAPSCAVEPLSWQTMGCYNAPCASSGAGRQVHEGRSPPRIP